MVKIKIQTKSKKCQNRLKRVSLEMTKGVSPRDKICFKETSIQSEPMAMCSPCVPSKAKKEDRKALRCQLLPSETNSENSLSSRVKKVNPRISVITNQNIVCFLFW